MVLGPLTLVLHNGEVARATWTKPVHIPAVIELKEVIVDSWIANVISVETSVCHCQRISQQYLILRPGRWEKAFKDSLGLREWDSGHHEQGTKRSSSTSFDGNLGASVGGKGVSPLKLPALSTHYFIKCLVRGHQ